MIKSGAVALEFLRICLVAAVGWLMFATPASAQVAGTAGFLEAQQAFRLSAQALGGGRMALTWRIAPGYYLYRDRIRVSAVPADLRADVSKPPGVPKQDPNFGTVQVYHDQVRVEVRAPGAAALDVTWQGCAQAGLCYPPEQRTIDLAAGPAASSPAAGEPAASVLGDQQRLPDWVTPGSAAALGHSAAAPAARASAPLSGVSPSVTASSTASDGGVSGLLHSRPLSWTLPLFLLLGIGLAFTPCVLPMLPIVSGIVVGSQARPRRAFALSLAFVLAMAAVYALLGTGAALAGSNLQAVLQNPLAIAATAALFVALSLSMFGWYELQLPAFLRERLGAASPQGGGLAGAAALGALSALLVSPCMTAPLAGTLLYIAQTGKVARGAALLFALGIGMGLPMLVVSTLGARALPRPGPWMNRVKAAFGFGLLAVAVGMLQRLVAPSAALLLWGAWLALVAVALWSTAPTAGSRVLARGASLLAAVWAAAMVIGASAGATDTWQPLAPLARTGAGDAVVAQAPLFDTLSDPRQLAQRLDAARAGGRPVLLDFSADWCTSCKTLDHAVFEDPAVRQALAAVVSLRADVTAGSAAQQALMRDYGVMGPPTVMLFDAQGRERRDDRLVGEFTAADLLARVRDMGARS
jgi:thioredoxin:protein disulfide reductase